jgi:hypothetical protein
VVYKRHKESAIFCWQANFRCSERDGDINIIQESVETDVWGLYQERKNHQFFHEVNPVLLLNDCNNNLEYINVLILCLLAVTTDNCILFDYIPNI